MTETETQDEPAPGHEHEFDGAPKKGLVRMCVDRKCLEMRVGTGKRWRELTPTERINVTLHMMEANIIAQTGIIIHGKEKGMEWARRVLGYDQ